ARDGHPAGSWLFPAVDGHRQSGGHRKFPGARPQPVLGLVETGRPARAAAGYADGANPRLAGESDVSRGRAMRDTRAQGPATPAAQRLPAELRHAEELAALAAVDTGPRPEGWRLSPRAVRR